MSARKPEPGASRLGRFARRWRLDRNPLRRGADRVETVVVALLVAAFLIGAPFAALATGAWFHGLARQSQLAQAASRWQVTAVVLAVTPAAPGSGGLIWQAQARYTAPDGRLVTQEVPVVDYMAVGRMIPVWTDRTGNVTSPPLLDSQVAGYMPLGEAAGSVAVVAVLTAAGALARWRLNKRRIAEWDADWRATEPRWTTRA